MILLNSAKYFLDFCNELEPIPELDELLVIRSPHFPQSFFIYLHVIHRRLWFQRAQEVLGEGTERLHAGHEVRQANVRCRPHHPREGAEHPHPSGGRNVHQRDRSQRFVTAAQPS